MTYWIVKNNQQINAGTLTDLLARTDLRPTTPVWHDGLPDWTTAGNIPSIARAKGWLTPAAFAPTHDTPIDTIKNTPITPDNTPDDPNLPPPPPTYLLWAILTTLCCCLPTGIIAIIYASKVTPAYQQRQYLRAQQASTRAGWWIIISIILGLITAPFLFLINLLTL